MARPYSGILKRSEPSRYPVVGVLGQPRGKED